jgi:DNA replication protein DnaC
LSDDEIVEAIREAQEKKYYEMKRQEYRDKITAVKTFPAPSADAWLSEYRKLWKTDDDNNDIVQQLCYYFSGDDRFNGSHEKGVLITGGVGTGKSTLMHFFAKNAKRSYRLVGCRSVETEFSTRGDESMNKYSFLLQVATNADPYGHHEIGFCFDDLGTESNGKHFGKEKNIMAEIILNRYDNQIPFNSTHITTNLSSKDILDQYGSRFLDRCREMFNILVFKPEIKSRRK